MSIAQTPVLRMTEARHEDSLHPMELIQAVLGDVSKVIAPVWPLQDYVAVNPYAGLGHLSFLKARSYLKAFSDCEMLMPLEYYAGEFHCGNFTFDDIDQAIEELSVSRVAIPASSHQVVEILNQFRLDDCSRTKSSESRVPNRSIRTFAEVATDAQGVNWTEAIVDEISKHCSMHYDEGQSTWSSPYKDLTLYQAWRSVALHDRNIEILGLDGFRRFAARLPQTPEAAIVQMLMGMDVPQPLWTSFLLCQAFSIPGWSSWCKYRTEWTDAEGVASNDLAGLIAIRLAYDAALAESKSLTTPWISEVPANSHSVETLHALHGDDSKLRYLLLRASEIAYRTQLLKSVASNDPEQSNSNELKLGQMVFCIDVRSERIRRHLESQSSAIETLGFAGFFGMAFEYAELGQVSGKRQLPVLLKPQFKVHEGDSAIDSPLERVSIERRKESRNWRGLWKSFQSSAVGCFSFVETTGLLYGFKLLGRVLGGKPAWYGSSRAENSAQRDHDFGPTLRGLSQQGISSSRQVELAEGMLRNLGLTKNFAKLVVFCGHACQTENNPLAAGLDCGACGGHSGEPNARFAALLLNQPHVRTALAERGIDIPPATHFLGALHNTTTDQITFFDIDTVPVGLLGALQELKNSCDAATKQTQIERMPIVTSSSLQHLMKRAHDWSEVRPEWGLAGNAAFIVAPRWMTKRSALHARAFLHSYDYTQDEGGKVLETIMTAPMIVANWINLQYYASTVDNGHFGSGNKTVHNVVGGFGILSGNGGDLMTGLPWQSLHTGQSYQHPPQRLQVVIAAPRPMIDRVVAKHELVANLVGGGWLQLMAIESDKVYLLQEKGTWREMDGA